ncbi:MAG: SusE domain-containing protein [Alistipes sp.]|nr:SusE domain-containing protein [Alistipes sp.]
MNKIVKLLSISVVALFAACTSDMDYNAGHVSSIEELYAPSEGYYLELVSGSTAATTFSWSPANVSDGYAPMYELVFYKDAAGQQEISRISAGTATSVSVPHKTINKIMNATGTEPEAIGTLYWSAVASRSIVESETMPKARALDVKRLKGFKVAPERLYLTGSATEAGASIANAMPFSVFDDGEVFEIFTQLSSGDFNITDGTDDSARRFNISGGLISEENSSPISSSYNGVYRIRIDMATCAATIDKVENMRWVMCIQKNVLCPMVYQGNGVWYGEGFETNFNSGWNDDRYFFRAELNGQTIKIGNNKMDFGGAPSDKPSYTWNVYFTEEGNPDWDYSFKAISAYHGSVGMHVNVKLVMNASAEYYHTIDYTDLE